MKIHIQLVKGPKQSACGLRRVDIRKTEREVLWHLGNLERLPNPKIFGPTYEYCDECLEDPRFQMMLLREIDV